MKPALVVQHGPLGPPAILAEWMGERGISYLVHRADQNGTATPSAADHAFVAVLGSRFNPAEHADEPSVAVTRKVVEQALEHDVPVLGLCFGGQLLSHVLGGEVDAIPSGPELGWHTIESDDHELVPAGPWLQWHWHRFTTPPGADEIARSDIGTQAFTHGPHLGTQFHPESTIEVVARWAETDAERLAAQGVDDGRALLEEGRAHADVAARNARRLFDGFLDRARNGGRES